MKLGFDILPRTILTAALIALPGFANAQTAKPNILVIWGDDVGSPNVSAYTLGLMGYKTPNIDRVASEGLMFTDYYAEQSCTAGRASFITGQSGLRTGLTKVGLPGAALGLQKEDLTIAEALKPLGYATGQFGKNHLGDRNEYLPTVHGFDEFFGNLYHLNAEEEPELADYPKDPAFKAKFGPRGVIKSKATDNDDPTVDPRFGPVGKQTIEDTGPLTKKRMETIDDETTNAAIDYIQRQPKAGKPFFCGGTVPGCIRTARRPESMAAAASQSPYTDGMLEHDDDVGKLLKALDDLGIADNTIVIYGTDNGAHELLARRRHDAVPQREEYQLGRRLPRAGNDPLAGQDQAGQVTNEIIQPSTGSRRCLPWQAIPALRTGCSKARMRATGLTKSTSTDTTSSIS